MALISLLALLALGSLHRAYGSGLDLVQLPLLEASGAASDAGDALAAFTPSGAPAVRGALVAGARVSLLGGPTPFVIASADNALPPAAVAGGAPFAAAALGDSLAVLRAADIAGNSELVVVDGLASLAGAPGAVTSRALALGAPACVALAPLAGGAVAAALAQPAASSAGLLVLVNAGDLSRNASVAFAAPPRAGRFAWAALASGGGWLAAARWAAPDAPAPAQAEVFLFSEAALFAAAVAAGPGRAAAAPAATALLNCSTQRALISATIGDVFGDGAPALHLVYADSTVETLWLSPGAAPLLRAAAIALDPAGAAAATWRAAAAGPWLAPPVAPPAGAAASSSASGAPADASTLLAGEAQLMGLRAPAAPGGAFKTTLLLFGRPAHWLRRRASVAGARGMQELKVTYDDAGPNVDGLVAPLDVGHVRDMLRSTHTNLFLNNVCDCSPGSGRKSWSCSPLYNYLDFVRLLDATAGFLVDGQQVRLVLGLFPPSEAVMPPSSCRPPPDSPLTPFDEAALFAGANYTDYVRWGQLAGLLAQQYPHLSAVDIDDFDLNVEPGVPSVFTGQSLAQITSGMRARAPWLAFSSVVYAPFTASSTSARSGDAVKGA